MPKIMCLYLDNSGTRNPDRKIPEQFMYCDWFALGGYISNEEDEGIIRTAHANKGDTLRLGFQVEVVTNGATRRFICLSDCSRRIRARIFSLCTTAYSQEIIG